MPARPSAEVVAANVRKYRKALGWTQGDLADLTAIPQPRISVVESGQGDPKQSTIDRIADALGIPVAVLYVVPEPVVPPVAPPTTATTGEIHR